MTLFGRLGPTLLIALASLLGAGAFALFTGLPYDQAARWSAIGGIIPLLAAVRNISIPLGIRSDRAYRRARRSNIPSPSPVAGPWPWRLPAAVAAGLVLGLVIAVAFFGVPAHQGRRFEQFNVESSGYYLRVSVPLGVRNYEAASVRALLRDVSGSADPAKPPTLQAADVEVDATPLQTLDSDEAGMEWSWAVKADAGSFKLTIDYQQPIFGAPKVRGVQLPEGVTIESPGERIEVLKTGVRPTFVVLTAIGLTAYAQNVAAAIGALGGFIASMLGLFGKKE